MPKSRSRRRTRPVRPKKPRCECRHSYEPDGRCGQDATARVTLVCGVAGCDCAAGVRLGCDHCVMLWSRSATEDGVELRIRPL